MENLQNVLLGLFSELDEETKEIVSEVYALEKEYMDFFQSPHGINEKIKDIIDKHSRYILTKEGNYEN